MSGTGVSYSIEKSLLDSGRIIEVDQPRMMEILGRDFPEISPGDWSSVHLHISDGLDQRLGGFTVERAKPHNIWALRLTRLFKQAEYWSGLGVHPSNYKFPYCSDETEVGVALNLSHSHNVGNRPPFFKVGDIYSIPMVLGHEMKHAADKILELRARTKDESDLIEGLARKKIAEAVSFVSGAGAIAVGAVTSFSSIGYESMELAEVGGSSMLIGGALAFMSIASVMRFGRIKPEDLPSISDLPYGNSEAIADAYAIATEKDWKHVLKGVE